jgi:hypothetical protein
VCIVGIHRYRFVHCSLSYGKLLTLLLSSYTITCPRTMQILHTKHPPTVPPGLYREQAFGNLEKSSKQAADDVRVVNAQLMTCTHRDTVVERSPSCKCKVQRRRSAFPHPYRAELVSLCMIAELSAQEAGRRQARTCFHHWLESVELR